MVVHWVSIKIREDVVKLLDECRVEMQRHHKNVFARPQDISYNKLLNSMGRFYLDE